MLLDKTNFEYVRSSVHLLVYCLYNLQKVTPAGICGTTRWKATKVAPKTMTNLDETGLEVAGCRYALALKAINICFGEKCEMMYRYFESLSDVLIILILTFKLSHVVLVILITFTLTTFHL